MSTTTPKLGLVKNTGTEKAQVSVLNANWDAVDVYAIDVDTRVGLAGTRTRHFRGLTADIGTVTGPVKGDTYQETDGLFRKFEHDGTGWVRPDARIAPTAATGTGVTLAGDDVTLANATGSITLTIPFSTRFDRYVIDIEVDSASSDLGATFQLRAGGATIATNYYGSYNEQAIGVGPTKADSNNTASFPVGRFAVNGGSIQLEIVRPMKTASNKVFMVRSQDAAAYFRTGGGYCSASPGSAVDGVVIDLGAATVISGRIRVIGVV